MPKKAKNLGNKARKKEKQGKRKKEIKKQSLSKKKSQTQKNLEFFGPRTKKSEAFLVQKTPRGFSRNQKVSREIKKRSIKTFVEKHKVFIAEKKAKKATKKKKPKALVLFSGGLDSMLVLKIMQSLGFEVEAVFFQTHFYSNKKRNIGESFCEKEKIKCNFIELENDYFQMIQNPKHGYGKNLNPCIDCHAFMFKKAESIAKKIKADVIATGEVLGERSMSQTIRGLYKVDALAGLKNGILRPLSAKLLPETVYEKTGLVDRNKLYGIKGRKREKQFELVKKFKIKIFETPAGGCLLTDKNFSIKIKDLIDHKDLSKENIDLLKIGRYFRTDRAKLIVGRNESENEKLIEIGGKKDILFEVINIPSPITLLRRNKANPNIYMAAALTAYYSDAKNQDLDSVQVEYKTSHKISTIIVDLKKDKKKIEEFIEKNKL